nr:hypothetical protein [Arsenicicoccus piscis]
MPTKPQAWLLTVARNRLRDRWRSAEHSRTTLLVPEAHDPAVVQEVDVDAIPDHRLALMMVCAHPAIDRTLHTPLMLTTVLGCTAAQVGRAYAVPRRPWRPGWCAPSVGSRRPASRSSCLISTRCPTASMPFSRRSTAPWPSSGAPPARRSANSLGKQRDSPRSW